MTATVILPDPFLSFEEFDLQPTLNLQDIIDLSAEFLKQYQIDHAVLYSCPSEAWSMALPLLTIHPALDEAFARVVRLNLHPVTFMTSHNTDVTTLTDLRVGSEEPIVEQLFAAFGKAGMRDIYELPISRPKAQPFVLELARIGQPIDVWDLEELQTMARFIPENLPSFLRSMPRDCECDEAFEDLRVS